MKTVQIIFNIFRRKPAEEHNIGILARVPLASGLLSGKMTRDSEFPADDHRNFNRDGTAFDRGRRSPACRSRRASKPPRN